MLVHLQLLAASVMHACSSNMHTQIHAKAISSYQPISISVFRAHQGGRQAMTWETYMHQVFKGIQHKSTNLEAIAVL
jgi:hypothetical protein